MSRLNRSATQSIQHWTPAKLADFSRHMADAYGFGWGQPKSSTHHSDAWTSERLAHLGKTLSHGFHPGL